MENLDKREEEPQKSFASFRSRYVNEVFDIGEVIGNGTFGVVMKAKLRSDPSQNFALKKILLDNEKTYGFPMTAIREISILNKFKHENLSNLEEVLVSRPQSSNNYRGSVYLAFKYMEHDLYGLLQSEQMTLTLPQIKNIAWQILKGIEFLHSNNIMHRDLKTSNILVSNKGEVKLTDFGLARNLSQKSRKPYTPNVVTIWYRSPEILLGSNNYTFSADMWSFGCIFVELLLSKSIFQSFTEKDLFIEMNEQIGALRECNFPNISRLPFYDKFKTDREFSTEGKLRDNLTRKFPADVVSFAMRLLELDPKKRMSAKAALQDPFFTNEPKMCRNEDLPKLENHFHEMNIRNGEHKKNGICKISKNTNSTENSSLNQCEEMIVGKRYDINNVPKMSENFLKNKRKSVTSD